ncbi:hypothetical protein H681_03040 [Pseudomonas sp. ATCC 13867]|nr:hypothetical protein H681_03040 [Pseudomonas sp. ATCC 13867]
MIFPRVLRYPRELAYFHTETDMTTVAILYREAATDEISALLQECQLVALPAVMRTEGRRLATTLRGERDAQECGILLLEIPLRTREYGEDFVAVLFHTHRYEYRSPGRLQAVMQKALDAWEHAGRPDEFFIDA